MDLIAELTARGLIHVSTDLDALAARVAAGPISLYYGCDPTADSLHIGNLIGLVTLRRFQDAGHTAIALAGGATGMIGDPGGKSEERNLLTFDELAANLGGTDGVLATETNPVAAVMDLTDQRGADVAFEVLGRGATIEQAMAMTRRGGQTVLVGIPAMDVTLTIPAMVGVVLAEKTLKGCWLGSADIRRDIPRLVELYQRGDLRLEELISHRIALADVNDALAALEQGTVARSVIVY